MVAERKPEISHQPDSNIEPLRKELENRFLKKGSIDLVTSEHSLGFDIGWPQKPIVAKYASVIGPVHIDRQLKRELRESLEDDFPASKGLPIRIFQMGRQKTMIAQF